MTNYALDENILNYYNRGRERGRLDRGLSKIEFLRTLDVFARFLPEPPLSILDLGGGAGRYAAVLSEQGYKVSLLDPVELHVEQASEVLKRFPESSVRLGDARALPFETNSADVALLLGPLYHLQDEADRVMVLTEAFRVLKSGGLLFAAVITRFAPAIVALQLLESRTENEFIPYLNSDSYLSGNHNNPDALDNNFTTSYFHHPNHLEEEFIAAKFEVQSIIALEGLAVSLTDIDSVIANSIKLPKLMEMLEKLECEPSILGVSPHVMVVAKKA